MKSEWLDIKMEDKQLFYLASKYSSNKQDMFDLYQDLYILKLKLKDRANQYKSLQKFAQRRYERLKIEKDNIISFNERIK